MSRDPVLEGLIRGMLIREAVSSTNLDRDQTFSLEDATAAAADEAWHERSLELGRQHGCAVFDAGGVGYVCSDCLERAR